MRKVQVFLSSAMTGELKAERQVIRSVFQQNQHLKDFYELYAIEEHASPKPIEEAFLSEVRECHIFIIILNKELREAVKKEFLEAKAEKKKIFAYIASDTTDRSEELNNFIRDEVYKFTCGNFYDAVELSNKISMDITHDLLNTYSGLLRQKSNEKSHVITHLPPAPGIEYRYFSIETIIELSNNEKFVDISPDQLAELALIWISESGEYKEALLLIELAMYKEPNNWAHYQNRGIILETMGLHEPALHSFRKALSLNPKADAALYAIGKSMYDVGRFEEAIQFLQKSIELNPNRENAFSYLVNCYLRLDDRETALEYAKKAESNFPNNITRSNLALLLSMNGNLSEALEYLENTELDNFNRFNMKSIILYDAQRFEEALSAIEEISAHGISQYDVVIRKLNCLCKLNQEEKAIEWFNIVEVNFPVSANDYNNFGYALHSQFNRPEIAEALYRKALDINPTLMICWNNLQALYGDSKRFQEGLAACDDALKVNKFDTLSIQSKSAMLFFSNRIDDAIRFLMETGLNMAPYNGKREETMEQLMNHPAMAGLQRAFQLMYDARSIDDNQSWPELLKLMNNISNLQQDLNRTSL